MTVIEPPLRVEIRTDGTTCQDAIDELAAMIDAFPEHGAVCAARGGPWTIEVIA